MIKLPFTIIGNFIKFAGSRRGGIDPIRVALEEITKNFGSLTREVADKVRPKWRKTMKMMGDTGRTLRSVYGPGREGAAKAFGELFDTLGKMGPLSHRFRGEFENSGQAMLEFKNALNLTEEDFHTFGVMAIRDGKSVTESINDVASSAQRLGKRFNLEQKGLVRDIMEMRKDFDNFGHVAPESLGAVSVYAKQLGIDVKELGGIVDKFLNFDDAAKSAADLAAGFGVNIDALALTKAAAEDPAKALDLIRSKFTAAGISVDDMNAAQRKLLGDSVGLKGASLQNAFAAQNMGLSYDQVAASAADATSGQQDISETLKGLGKELPKTFAQGSKTFTSFMDAFTQGLATGITRSESFRKATLAVYAALYKAYHMGVRIGNYFMERFPGISDIFDGFAALFGAPFDKLIGNVEGALMRFIDAFSDPLKRNGALDTLLSDLSGAFHGWYQSADFQKMWTGLQLFGEAVGHLFLQAFEITAKYLVEGLAWLLEKLAWALENPDKIGAKWKEVSENMGKNLTIIFTKGFQYLSTQFGPMMEEPIKRLEEAALRAYEALKENFMDGKDLGVFLEEKIDLVVAKLEPHLENAGLMMMAIMWGPSVLKAAGGALVSFVGNMITGGSGAAAGGISGMIGRIMGPGTPTAASIGRQASLMVPSMVGPSSPLVSGIRTVGAPAMAASVQSAALGGVTSGMAGAAGSIGAMLVSPLALIAAAIAIPVAAMFATGYIKTMTTEALGKYYRDSVKATEEELEAWLAERGRGAYKHKEQSDAGFGKMGKISEILTGMPEGKIKDVTKKIFGTITREFQKNQNTFSRATGEVGKAKSMAARTKEFMDNHGGSPAEIAAAVDDMLDKNDPLGIYIQKTFAAKHWDSTMSPDQTSTYRDFVQWASTGVEDAITTAEGAAKEASNKLSEQGMQFGRELLQYDLDTAQKNAIIDQLASTDEALGSSVKKYLRDQRASGRGGLKGLNIDEAGKALAEGAVDSVAKSLFDKASDGIRSMERFVYTAKDIKKNKKKAEAAIATTAGLLVKYGDLKPDITYAMSVLNDENGGLAYTMDEILVDLDSTTQSIAAIGDSGNILTEYGASLFKGIQAYTSQINKAAPSILRAGKKIEKGLIKDVGVVLQSVAEIDYHIQGVLDQLGNTPIQTKVTQMAKALSLNSRKIRISAGSYNVNIRVHMKLGRKDVVKLLVNDRSEDTGKGAEQLLTRADFSPLTNHSSEEPTRINFDPNLSI